ncbi:MAG: hypothetical protein M3401_15045 [Actinomycetota bacterium]|nr:hypothetical protein [Actinomycetota bacterium]
MSTLIVIVVVIGLWMVVMLVVVGACWAAQRGDEALFNQRAVEQPMVEEPAAEPAPMGVQTPSRRLIRRPRCGGRRVRRPPPPRERA